MENLNLIGRLIAFHTNFARTKIILGVVSDTRMVTSKNLFGFKKQITEYKIVWQDKEYDDTWTTENGIKTGAEILNNYKNL
jgi:hypothetical protein